MGILETSKPVVTSPTTRRKSGLDFGSLKPLNAATGTKNFGGYRDGAKSSPKAKNKSEDAMDSDADDEDDAKIEDADEEKDALDKGLLSPEDAAKQGELAEGVRKIKVSQIQPAARRLSKLTTPQLKRQHSAEPLPHAQASGSTSASPHSGTPAPAEASSSGTTTTMTTGTTAGDAMATDESVASPFKKHRASLPGFDSDVRKSLGQALVGGKERGNSEGMVPTAALESRMEEDEEL